MNTEDERRDEAEAALTAATGVRLEGDVITANGSIISGIIPMENYLHNTSSVYPFSSRYHVYNLQPSAKDKNKFSKNKFSRTNQLEQDLFSDQEYLDVEELNATGQQITCYENRENNEQLDSEPTETSSSQRNRAYIQRRTMISDSGSERTFNTHLNHLKAHRLRYSEQSEVSLSSERASHRKFNKRNKVFCKTSSHLLSKQQRKNYKHMISDDESEVELNSSELMSEPVQLQTTDDFYVEEDDDRASVCSCTCYGNNQGSRTNKAKKSAKASQTNLEILNRKLPSAKKYKNQSSGKSMRSSNVKYKHIKSINRNRLQQDEQQFDLNQMNELNQMHQMQEEAVAAETILRPIYYQATPLSTATNPTATPLPDELLNSSMMSRAIYLTNNPDQQLNTTSEAINKQRPFLVMQSNRINPYDLNRQSTDDALRGQFICNLNTTNISNLSNSEHVLNRLNAINAKNLAYFLDSERLSPGQTGERKQIIELNEKQCKQYKDKLKIGDKAKDKKRKTNHQSTSKSKTFEKQGSSEYLLKRSNEGFVVETQQQTPFIGSKSNDQMENEVRSDFLTIDQDTKLTTQRASI